MKTSQSPRDRIRRGSFALPGMSAMDKGRHGREAASALVTGGAFDEAYQDGAYHLPPLPYDYNASNLSMTRRR